MLVFFSLRGSFVCGGKQKKMVKYAIHNQPALAMSVYTLNINLAKFRLTEISKGEVRISCGKHR